MIIPDIYLIFDRIFDLIFIEPPPPPLAKRVLRPQDKNLLGKKENRVNFIKISENRDEI